jgi:DNA-binding protein H-NS
MSLLFSRACHNIVTLAPFSLLTATIKCGLWCRSLNGDLFLPPGLCWFSASKNPDRAMNTDHLNSLSVDELWKLHEEVATKLEGKILAEKARLEERLRKIGMVHEATRIDRKRRPYPPVRPKYRNPKNPAETWSGRGRLPRWLRPQLRGGRKLADFLIAPALIRSGR